MRLADGALLCGGVPLDLPLQFPGCLVFGLLRLAQNAIPDLVEVVGNDAQAGVTGIATETFVRTAVKPVVLEAVDVGFDGTVGVAEFDIVCLVFLCGFPGIAFAFLWHDDPSGNIFKRGLVGLAAETLIEADAFDGAGPVLRKNPGDSGWCLGMLVGIVHDLIVKDHLILVGGDEEFATKFHRTAGFALADPLRVGLEERENLFLMRDGFALEDAPVDEVDVFVEHFNKVGQLDEATSFNGAERQSAELAEGGVGLDTQGVGLVNIGACSLLETCLFVGTSLLAEVAKHAHLVFETGADRLVFPPAGEVMIFS